MSLIAVDVCLVSSAFDTAAMPLSYSLCPAPDEEWNEADAYRLIALKEKKLQTGFGHAHCTLAQLCVRAMDLNKIKEIVRNIWLQQSERKTRSKDGVTLSNVEVGPAFTTLADGTEVRLPMISITHSDALQNLHHEIVEAVYPLHVQVRSADVAKSSFHPTFPATNKATVTCMKEFFEQHAGINYHPHITLGASPIKSIDELTFFQETTVPWRECRLVVSHMGNYCSCFELLE